MAATATAFRLPGVHFLPPSRAAAPGLPPLDVVAFVGFAERGPLHLPVPVEDLDMYRAVFGGDLPLARETDGQAIVALGSPPSATPLMHEANGRIVYANLPHAVAAFFANGGRRCYVVRVAGKKATASQFKVPGIVALDRTGTARPVQASASSAGRWSAALRLATRLNSVLLPKTKFVLQKPWHLTWETGGAPLAILAGDLLRLTLAGGEQWLFPVAVLKSGSKIVTLKANAVWQAPSAGLASPPQDELALVNPVGLPAALELISVERLRFDLAVTAANQRRITLSELAFNAPHPRFWGDVLALESSTLRSSSRFDGTFRQVFDNTNKSSQTDGNAGDTLAARTAELYRALQTGKRLATEAGDGMDPVMLTGLLAPLKKDRRQTYLPLGMSPVDSGWAAPDPIGDDDLDAFTPSLFLDGYLVPTPRNSASSVATTLMAAAIDRYYLQNRRLHGLHGLTFIEEVALISLPDASHRGWRPNTSAETPVPDVNASQPAAVTEQFQDCAALHRPSIQTVEPPLGPVTGGTEVTITGTGFTLATRVSFAGNLALDVEVLSSTQLQCKTPVPGNAGLVAVEVATENGSGLKTNAFAYQWPASAPQLPEMLAATEFDLDQALLPLHQALLNFCQARGDTVGIFTLPGHFEKRHCLEWQERLRERLGLPRRGARFTGVRDLDDLSYAAVYHPWLLVRDTAARNGLRPVPPDGLVCGMIAAREQARQVWVAPANVPVHGALGLASSFSEEDWADLYAAQFNLIRDEARDLRAMSAQTLSDERSLLQLSVRRLLIQLRKAAVEKGMDYVFASNHEQTRNAIRLSLENLLRFMFERGAFAGATQPSAFRITMDAGVNPPESIEQGRLIARIQVAPSEPLEFITVQLTRTGEDLLQAMEA